MPRRPVRLAALLVAPCLLAAACGDDDDDATRETTSSVAEGEEGGIELRDDSLRAETFAEGLDQPSALAFIPEVGPMVTEKASGRVLPLAGGEVGDPVLDLAVNYFDERGLLGIAVHPDFPTEPYVYLHWTSSGEGDGDEGLLGSDTDEPTAVPDLGNRVDRFRWEDDELTFDRNIVRFPSNTLDSDTSGRIRGNHDAGPLAFGPDGKLYVMMGDQNLRGQLQNIVEGPAPDDAHLAGVILRLNDDGTVPPDNPFAGAAALDGEAADNAAMIWVYGIRNSFGLAFEPTSGALWQTENGDDSYDEVNVFDAGANSGWVQFMGPSDRFDSYRELEVGSEDGIDTPSFGPDRFAESQQGAMGGLWSLPQSRLAEPVLSWVHPPAVTAVAFVVDDRLGAPSQDTAWFGTVLTDSLLRYPLAPDGRSLALEGPLADAVDDNSSKGDLGESEPYVVGTGFGIITDIDQGPDGDLYVVSLGDGTVHRLTSAGS
jgi:aldose sugar dehydrogenase